MIEHRAPWLVWDLGETHDVLSWTLNRPGFVQSNRILWREVRDQDLGPDFDVMPWITREVETEFHRKDVCFLTSSDIGKYKTTVSQVDALNVQVVATVGLSNVERIGTRLAATFADLDPHWGTINIAVKVSSKMTQAALIEAISIATQARTAALMDDPITTPNGVATGTGTDCIAIASPVSNTTPALEFAGLHTELGEAIGHAVYTVMRDDIRSWKDMIKRSPICKMH